MNDSKNDIFIFFEYNGREINGIECFKEELEISYLMQGKDYSLPSFSEGGETWFIIFINSDFFELAKNVLIGGMVWDMLKHGSKQYSLRPFFKAIKQLDKSNQGTYKLKIQSIKFQFDDIEIIFGGLKASSIAAISMVFNEIANRKNEIEREVGLSISKIETPIFHNPKIDKEDYSPYLLETHPKNLNVYLNTWKIWFMNNRACKVYNLIEKKFSEAYPNK